MGFRKANLPSMKKEFRERAKQANSDYWSVSVFGLNADESAEALCALLDGDYKRFGEIVANLRKDGDEKIRFEATVLPPVKKIGV